MTVVEAYGPKRTVCVQTEATHDGQCLHLPLDDDAVHTGTEGKPTHTHTEHIESIHSKHTPEQKANLHRPKH